MIGQKQGGLETASKAESRRPKILMTVDAVGGIWQYALDLASEFRSRADIMLVVLGPSPTRDQLREAQETGCALTATSLPLDWIVGDQASVDASGGVLADMAQQSGVDLVHLNHPSAAASARFPVPVIAVCHSCVATWWQTVRGGSLPEAFMWRTVLTEQGYRAANRLLAPTQAFADLTAEIYDLPEPPLVVRNGRRIDLPSHHETPDVFVFTAGRLWDEGKNVVTLDRAAARSSLTVIAAGSLTGPNGTRIHVRHIKPAGQLSTAQVRQFLIRRPIFASAALYEPFGLAVLEAAQAGCALVLSDIPVFRELWDGVALFVPPRDDSAFAEAFEWLFQHRNMRHAFGQAARERATRYSAETMCEGVWAVYESVLPGGGRTRVSKGAAA